MSTTATVVPETLNEIESWFAMPTERQQPGQQNHSASEQPKTAEFTAGPAKPVEQQQEGQQQQQEPPKKKVTEEEAHASAMTYVTIVETPIVGLGVFALNKRMKNKFTDKEIERGDDLYDRDESSITDPDDLALQRKFKRVVSKFERKKDALRFTEKEKKEMMPLLEEYVKVTGNTANPTLMLLCAFIDKVGKRVVDIFFD